MTSTRDDDDATATSVRFRQPSNMPRDVTKIVDAQFIGSRVRLGFTSVTEYDVNVWHDLRYGVFVRVTSVRSRQC